MKLNSNTCSSLVALLGIALLFGCSAPDVPDDTETKGHTTNHELAGRIVPEEELAGVLRQVGFNEGDVGKMVCTAKYESSFHEQATNKNTNGTTDFGIFQINSIHLGKTAGCPTSSSELFDVTTNAQCALGIFNTQGITAWVAYKSHQAECDSASAPAGGDPNVDPNADPSDPNAIPGADGGVSPNGDDDPCSIDPFDPACGADGGAGSDPCEIDPFDPAACGGDPGDGSGGGGGDDPCWDDPYAPGCGGDPGDDWGDEGWKPAFAFGSGAAQKAQIAPVLRTSTRR